MIRGGKTLFPSGKIVRLEVAADKVAAWKKSGRTIGLCHGGFDLLHPGQIKHLESASKWCDMLVVSITSDQFVRERKGKGRPIFSEKLRAYAAAAIQWVDLVVISDFPRGTEVIKALKPSYYIKGPDYIGERSFGIMAERAAVRSVGGTMKLTRDPKMSTTKIIRHIQQLGTTAPP